jgi:predicted ATP-binding protein involved in virulence
LHLQNFNIDIPAKNPHLIITGKNGSGKTILLRAIADFLDIVKEDSYMHFANYPQQLDYWTNKKNGNAQETMQAAKQVEYYQNKINELYGKVDIEMMDIAKIIEQYQKKNFIISFYAAGRLAKMNEPTNPTKPNLQIKGKASSSLTNQFLFFLSDLKVQEALARNEKQYGDADNIKDWFENFEGILKKIYNDLNLKLEFNYKNYSFAIKTEGKKFKFTEMSDGFIAAIDIIADLILKMQDSNSLTRNYQKQGIVLIDEIETHLHLELQRIVMPLLTNIFPNIQFIVTTHSPFVLNSMENAVAYDLEHRETISDLTKYSYEALAEGYFGVPTESSYMEMRLLTLKALLEKEDLSNGDKEQLLSLVSDFKKISKVASPLIAGEFMRLLVEYSDKINALQK